MRTLLIFGILLIFAKITSAEFKITKCYNISELTNWRTVKHFNEVRAGIAKRFQIANMQQLRYDPELHKFIKKMKSCEDIKLGSNYRVYDYSNPESYRVFDKFNHTETLKSGDTLEFANPLQNRYAVCDFEPPCIVHSHLEQSRLYQVSDITVFGPRGTLSVSDLKHGPPGSQCPKGKADDNLCLPYEVATTSSSNSILSYFMIPMMLLMAFAFQ